MWLKQVYVLNKFSIINETDICVIENQCRKIDIENIWGFFLWSDFGPLTMRRPISTNCEYIGRTTIYVLDIFIATNNNIECYL